MGEVFGFALEGVEVIEDGEALGEDGFSAEGEAVLREIAEGHAFDAGELAVVEGFDAAEDFEEGGFAGAVAADEASALVRRDEPVGVFEEEFLAEAFAGGGELEHASSIFSFSERPESSPGCASFCVGEESSWYGEFEEVEGSVFVDGVCGGVFCFGVCCVAGAAGGGCGSGTDVEWGG